MADTRTREPLQTRIDVRADTSPRQPANAAERPSTEEVVEVRLDDVSVSYSGREAVHGITLDICRNRVTALIGPSGCGKSTLLRCLNRMNDLIPTARVTGSVYVDGVDVNGPSVDPVQVRRHIGMVFQKPNPFPMSVRENIAFGPKRLGAAGNRKRLDGIVEEALRSAALWDEVKDQLDQPGTALSGGQQQRLCIARVLAVEPTIILMDEPCSALDPIATLKIEDLIRELVREFTIIIVTHNMQQAARVSDYTAFMLSDERISGQLIEYGPTQEIFTNPRDQRTEDYITGRFG